MTRNKPQSQGTITLGDTVIKVTENTKEVKVKMQPEDYAVIRWNIDRSTKHVSAEIALQVPDRGLSNSMKGQIGELIAYVVMNCVYGGIEGLIEHQQAGYMFDILDQRTGLRYDVKFSPLKMDKGPKAKYWKFHFASNKTRNDARQVSGTKYLKDYTQCCDAFILIGLRDEPVGSFEMFMIETTSPDVLGKLNIQVPSSGKSKFAKYKVDPETLTYCFSETGSVATDDEDEE